ncbi:AraC family transcriptional regulator [Geminicoccaceae bacterium 1502E]|nr:AraC family transcriptional regulator [Geminicoccaceae bacterium 1502E]
MNAKPGADSDPLSSLIRLCGLSGSLDLRCRMAGPYVVDHTASPPGEAAFHMVLDGGCRIETATGQAICRPGDLVLLPIGTAHRVVCLSAGLDSRAWISRNTGLSVSEVPGPPELDLICGRFGYQPTAGALLFNDLPDLLHIPQAELPPSLAEMIRADATSRPPGATELVTALTSVIFIIAIRRHLRNAPLDRGMLALIPDRGLAEALMAILREPAAPWTIDRLARRAHMSRATFLRRFTAAAGRGPADLLLDIRVHIAMRLLRDSGRSMGDIAHSVGYRSVTAFGRAFTRRTGITMSQARRRQVSPEPETSLAPSMTGRVLGARSAAG